MSCHTLHCCIQQSIGLHCSCRCTLHAAVAAWRSKEAEQGGPFSTPHIPAAAAPAEAEQAATSSETAHPAELTAPRMPLAQSQAAPSVTATAIGASVAEASPTAAEEASQDVWAAAPLDHESTVNAPAAPQSIAASEVQGGRHVSASASAQVDTPSAAEQQVLDTRDDIASAAAQAVAPSALHTAAASEKPEEGSRQAQLHSKGIIEGLLQSEAPWPDMDFEQLAQAAGEDSHHCCLAAAYSAGHLHERVLAHSHLCTPIASRSSQIACSWGWNTCSATTSVPTQALFYQLMTACATVCCWQAKV